MGTPPQMSPDEVWARIPDRHGYEVSTKGRVWDRYRDRLVSQRADPKGYAIALDTGVHRLVARAFYGPRPEGLVVRHLDGNPQNNCLENLTYGTHSENLLDQVRHGTHVNASKTHCPKGHEYGDVSWTIRGDRECKPCRADRERARRARHRDAAARISDGEAA